jgi:haloalkane dehalogenase
MYTSGQNSKLVLHEAWPARRAQSIQRGCGRQEPQKGSTVVKHVLAALACIFTLSTGDAIAEEAAAPRLPPATVGEAPMEGYRSVVIEGARLAYVDRGSGRPIVFIHGNPSSSYLWRNVLSHVEGQGRVIALDLAGMGNSQPARHGYRFADHARRLDAFMAALDLHNVVLVGHDWGAALSFDYAQRHPGNVHAIAFMEGVLPPAFPQPSFEAMGPEMGGMFRAFKDPVQGRQMVIEQNMFIEGILPRFINRPLGAEAMTEYRRPYLEERRREPLLAWPREVPIAGEPADVVAAMARIENYMTQSRTPALLLYADPGVLVPPQAVGWYTSRMPNLEAVYAGQGLHFIQEDQPAAIGRALSDWLRRH